MPTQNLLSETHGCKITGRVNEQTRTSTLTVGATRPVEVLAWWPRDWGEAKVTANHQTLSAKLLQISSDGFVLFKVGKGQWNVALNKSPG